tara:strand:+ start:513 stop:716 length:204 start_codon:yes stop_codon:yes gene_type:complete
MKRQMNEDNMKFLWKRIKKIRTSEIIDSAIKEYYEDKGMPVPQWRMEKNPQWWVEYLVELGMDPNNP